MSDISALKMISLLCLVFTAVTLAIFQWRRHSEAHSITCQYKCSQPRKYWTKDILFSLDFSIEMHNHLAMMKRNHDRFGLTYQVDSLFGNPVLNTIAPENLPLIHCNSKEYGIQPIRLPGMEYFCGKGFLTTDGPSWMQARKLLKPSFAKPNISRLDLLSRETHKLLQKIPSDGSTIDIQPLLFIAFLHCSLKFLLGIDSSEETNRAPYTPEQFLESFHAAVFGTGLRIMLGRFRGLAPKKAFAKDCKCAHEYIEYYIHTALEQCSHEENSSHISHHPRQRSMIQDLATQTDDIDFIRNQIIQGMLASQETISVLVSNTMFLLARNPSAWTQLRVEVIGRGEDLFTFYELSSFKPIQNILYEVLRLYPVFPMLGRTCLQDTTLPVGGGQNQDQPVYVAKGTFVVTSYITMHMDEKVFGKEPEAFRPDRWNEIQPSQWQYMPFGGGDRACLGREKVLAEAAYVIARFAQTFARVEPRDKRVWKEVVRMTAKNANGCKVGLFEE